MEWFQLGWRDSVYTGDYPALTAWHGGWDCTSRGRHSRVCAPGTPSVPMSHAPLHLHLTGKSRIYFQIPGISLLTPLLAPPLMSWELGSLACQVNTGMQAHWPYPPPHPRTSLHPVPGFSSLGGGRRINRQSPFPGESLYEEIYLLNHFLDELVGSPEVLRMGAFQQASQHLQEREEGMWTGAEKAIPSLGRWQQGSLESRWFPDRLFC